MSDRRVLAEHKTTRHEIVRYERAGKWWVELGSTDPYARRIDVTEAVAMIERDGQGDSGWHVVFGQPGGRQFDARVRRLDTAASPTEEASALAPDEISARRRAHKGSPQ